MTPRASHRELTGPSTSFVGREGELETLRAELAGGSRILTILGTGGIGKTRLALELARAERASGASVWFCDLEDARSALDALSTLARELDVALESSTSLEEGIEQLAAALNDRGRAVVVLDNFEQLVEHALATVEALSARVAELALVVTSRQRLCIAGEVVHDLKALDEDEAVRLFLERARAVRTGYEPGDELEAVRTICRELDGLPLAIELAAARMRVLSARELADRLSARFELLTASVRGTAPRHATLRAALDWSWDLLAPLEQRALAQCAVFEGGFTLEAAEAVVETSPELAVLDALQALCDKSLLFVREGEGPLRFGMYATVRQYARERLAELGVESAVHERHARHYLKSGMHWATRAEGHESAEARGRLADEQDNLLAVHRRALEPPVHPERALSAALVLQPLLITQGPAALRLELLDRALATLPEDPDGRLSLLAGWCNLSRADVLLALGRIDKAERMFYQALADARAHDNARLEGRCLWRLGSACWFRSDLARAEEYVTQALSVVRTAGDRVHEGRVLSSLGLLFAERGALDEARRSYEEALVVHEDAGDQRWHAATTGRLGELEDHAGRLEEARRLYDKALRLHRALDNRRHEAQTLIALAGLEHEERRLERARELYERALVLHRQIADRRAETLARAQLGSCLAELGETALAFERLDEALTMARSLDNRRLEALAFALRAPLEVARARRDEAERLLDAAARLAADDAVLQAVLALARGQLDVEAGERDRARTLLDTPLRARSSLVRRAALRLERALEREPPRDVLVVASTGSWFQPVGGSRVALDSRRSLRLLLGELARRRVERPGVAIGIEELFTIGWPGERARPQAATSRVYVALSTLRKLGLRDVLIKRDDGYLLDERVPLERWS